jgi:hypothetical protein
MLLAVLRMEIEEAIQEFTGIWTVVFADASLDQTRRSAKFEAVIEDLLKRRGLPENQKLYNGDGEESRCKAYLVFFSFPRDSNLSTGSCVPFLNPI